MAGKRRRAALSGFIRGGEGVKKRTLGASTTGETAIDDDCYQLRINNYNHCSMVQGSLPQCSVPFPWVWTLPMFHVCFHHTLFRGSRPQAKMIQGYCSYCWLVPEKRSWNKIINVELIRTRITVVVMLNTVPKSYKSPVVNHGIQDNKYTNAVSPVDMPLCLFSSQPSRR